MTKPKLFRYKSNKYANSLVEVQWPNRNIIKRKTPILLAHYFIEDDSSISFTGIGSSRASNITYHTHNSPVVHWNPTSDLSTKLSHNVHQWLTNTEGFPAAVSHTTWLWERRDYTSSMIMSHNITIQSGAELDWYHSIKAMDKVDTLAK